MDKKSLLILYGTQTGTAAYLAEELARQISSSVPTKVKGVDQYNHLELPNEKWVIFIVSTTGDGDMPSNMVKFWQFLLIKDLPKDSLKNINFSLFGLGDSSYDKFNYAGRKLRNRLLQLSANEFIKSQFGDEMHPCGNEQEFIPWLQQIKGQFNQFGSVNQETEHQILKIDFSEQQFEINQLHSNIIKLKQVVQLTPDGHDKQTYNFIFESDYLYEPGDILCIHPKNQVELVNQLIKLQQFEELQNQFPRIKWNPSYQNQKMIELNKSKSLRDLLIDQLDLKAPPSRHFIRVMLEYAENPIHKAKLEEMSSNTPEGIEEYYRQTSIITDDNLDMCIERKGMLLKCCLIFSRVKFLQEYQLRPCLQQEVESIRFLHAMVRMRYIQIGITVALVQYRTGTNRLITGYCSEYLRKLSQGDEVEGSIKKGQINFPKEISVPVVMVGPGTGVAPFISFIMNRQGEWDKTQQNDIRKENTILFFGSCYENKEFYYKQYLLDQVEKERMLLYTAFSRDQSTKVYVQSRIYENREFLSKHIQKNLENIMIIVAGTSRKMPQQVENIFKSILPNGDKVIQELKRRKQYVVECW